MARFRWMFLVSSSSIAQFVNEWRDDAALRRTLGLDYLLDGSVQRVAKRLRITRAAGGPAGWQPGRLDPPVRPPGRRPADAAGRGCGRSGGADRPGNPADRKPPGGAPAAAARDRLRHGAARHPEHDPAGACQLPRGRGLAAAGYWRSSPNTRPPMPGTRSGCTSSSIHDWADDEPGGTGRGGVPRRARHHARPAGCERLHDRRARAGGAASPAAGSGRAARPGAWR